MYRFFVDDNSMIAIYHQMATYPEIIAQLFDANGDRTTLNRSTINTSLLIRNKWSAFDFSPHHICFPSLIIIPNSTLRPIHSAHILHPFRSHSHPFYTHSTPPHYSITCLCSFHTLSILISIRYTRWVIPEGVPNQLAISLQPFCLLSPSFP